MLLQQVLLGGVPELQQALVRAYDVIRQRGCGGQVGGQRGRVEGWVRGREGGQEVWGGEEGGESGCSVFDG